MNEWIITGEFFRGMRESVALSRTGLARKLGVDPRTIKRLESGLRVRRRKFLETAYMLAIEHRDQEMEILRLQANIELLQSGNYSREACA